MKKKKQKQKTTPSKPISQPWASDSPLGLDDDALGSVVESLDRGDINLFESLNEQQRAYVVHFLESIQKQDPSMLEELYAVDYDRIPVEPDVFFTENDYMGHMGRDVFKAWWGHLLKVCDPASGIYELILTGAIGTGKTLLAMLILVYKIYRLSCLREPARYFGLAKKSRIVFGVYSLTLENAEDVGFYKLRDQCIDESPYFKEVFPRRPYGTDYIEWPQKNLKVITGSSALHSIGKDLFAIMIDEVNFMARGKGTAQKAHELATAVSRRLESRFMTGIGTQDIPGICIFVSSKKAETDYLQQRVKKVRGLPGVHVVDGPLWDFNEKIRYSGVTFRVMLGDAVHDPQILDDVSWEGRQVQVEAALSTFEEARLEGKIISPPVEHFKAFIEDLIGAIRDVAGVATASTVNFFPRKKVIQDMFEEGKDLPLYFRAKTIKMPIRSPVKLTTEFDLDLACGVRLSRRRPHRHPASPRYVHVDLARNKDAVGIVMLHPSEFAYYSGEEVQGVEERGVEKAIEVDFAIRVTTDEMGEDIDFAKIVEFLIWLKSNGFWLRRVTYDGYQSAGSIQDLKKFGIDAGVRSTVRSMNPYNILQRIMGERRISAPQHPVLERELGELEYDADKDKVDHPKLSSTGVPGCLAGDTEISLLDGREVSIRELAAKNHSNIQYVYTVADGEISFARAIKPRLTARKAETVIVVIDGVNEVCCTPDHLFMLREGGYKAAAKLIPGDSLMPLYRKTSTMKTHRMKGYELFQGLTGKWHYTHRMVGREKYGTRYTGNQHGQGVLHHQQGKRNNTPETLLLVSIAKHAQLHKDDIMKRRADPVFEKKRQDAMLAYARSKIGRARSRANLKALHADPVFAKACAKRAAIVGRRTGSENLIAYNKSPEHRRKASEIGKKTIWQAIEASRGPRPKVQGNKNPHARKDITFEIICTKALKVTSTTELCRILMCSAKVIYRHLKEHGLTPTDFTRKFFPRRLNRPRKKNNHTVWAVRPGPRTDVYDITVPGTKNFALSVGIFVHNSNDLSDALAGANYECIIDKLTPQDAPPEEVESYGSTYEKYLDEV